MNILHLFSISIIISGSLYPVFALDTPQVCDANSLPHYGPHNPSHIYIKDTSGNLPYIPLTDHTAILHDDDVWNTYPEPRTIQVTLTIHNQDTGQLVFNQTQSLQMQACSGPESVKWRFVPIQVANYIVTISDNRDKENMIFNSILDATKSQTVSSPLEQLRFGIDSHNIACKQDLQLVIKSEDGSTACVKPEHVTRLVQNGWALSNPFDRIADTDILSAKTYNLKQVHYYDSSNLNPKVSLYDYSYDGIDKDGLVSINNQAFYQTTLNNDIYKLKDMSVQFHNVTFSFPEGTLTTPGGAFVNLDVKFKDGLEEIYGGTTLVQNGTVTKISGIPIPTQYGPHVATNSITILGNHTMPQAGITIYGDKIKLLVSVNNQTSSSTNYTKDSKVTDDATYLSQTVDEWKSKTPEQLRAYYIKYKDAFYDELGSFLIKDEMKKELEKQKIQNINDDFKVFPGITLDSLPPHISYDAVVNATDGNSYLLLGGVFANKIDSSLKIIKLVFDKNALHSLSTGNGPSYPDPSTNAHVDNSTSQEKVQIAGTYIENSDIPWSSVGTGNYGVIQIGLYTSVYHMIPDAQKYYTARALQLIPFYVPVKILPPPSTEK